MPAADVGEAADRAEDFAELVGAVPRDGEGGDGAGARAADAAACAGLWKYLVFR